MLTLIAYVVVSVLYVSLLILSSVQKPKTEINTSYSIFIAGLLLWTITLYVYFFIDTGEQLLFWGRLNYAAGFPLYFGLAAFFYYFPKKNIKLPKLILWSDVFATIALFAVTLFTPLIDANEVMTVDGLRVTFGKLYFLFPIYIFSHLLVALFFGFQKLNAMKSIERIKLDYSFWVFGLTSAVLVLMNGILPAFDIYILQDYSFLIMTPVALVSFYSVVKYRFLNIKFVLTRALKVIISLFLATVIAYLFSIIVQFFFAYWPPFLFIFFGTACGIAVFLLCFKFLTSNTFHKVFGISNVEYFRQVVMEFRDKNVAYKTISDFRASLEESFHHRLGISFAHIILCDQKNKKKLSSIN